MSGLVHARRLFLGLAVVMAIIFVPPKFLLMVPVAVGLYALGATLESLWSMARGKGGEL